MVWCPDPSKLKVEWYPPKTRGGMQTGSIPSGVKVTHLPTGEYAICEQHRSQSENRRAALEMLAKKLDARDRDIEAKYYGLQEAQRRRGGE